MKIVRDGLNERWWHDKILKCEHCCCEMQLEPYDDNDPNFIENEWATYVRIPCVWCKKPVVLMRDTRTDYYMPPIKNPFFDATSPDGATPV